MFRPKFENGKFHPDMNPYQAFRLCPNVNGQLSRAIIVGLDHTGSMNRVYDPLKQKLRRLFTAVQEKKVIPRPQIMFASIGDAYDHEPDFYNDGSLQVGQFLGDINDLENELDKITRACGGGGNNHESYDLLLYFAAHKTQIDCFDVWREKGFLFVIGDDYSFETVNQRQIEAIIGDRIPFDISLQELINTVKEKYHTFFVIPDQCYGLFEYYTLLYGRDHVVCLDSPHVVCETIVSIMALYEGYLDTENYESGLADLEIEVEDVRTVSKALIPIAQSEELLKHRSATLRSGSLPTPAQKKQSVTRITKKKPITRF